MRLASCIGNHFDLTRSPLCPAAARRETAAALAEPLAQEIIAPIGEGYKYAPWSETSGEATLVQVRPRRLQQAAYAMTPPAERPRLHDQIGRLIMERSTPEQREERLFEIVGRLNLAHGGGHLARERAELARLNLRAGQKAKDLQRVRGGASHLRPASNCRSRSISPAPRAQRWPHRGHVSMRPLRGSRAAGEGAARADRFRSKRWRSSSSSCWRTRRGCKYRKASTPPSGAQAAGRAHPGAPRATVQVMV